MSEFNIKRSWKKGKEVKNYLVNNGAIVTNYNAPQKET